jgi:hypothetical protein
MGKCEKEFGDTEKALRSYERSLKYDNSSAEVNDTIPFYSLRSFKHFIIQTYVDMGATVAEGMSAVSRTT